MGRWTPGSKFCCMCTNYISDEDDFCSKACEIAYEEEQNRLHWLEEIADENLRF